jgi:uncharacterized membrane-anchored protein YhcB (DUF1043 family)
MSPEALIGMLIGIIQAVFILWAKNITAKQCALEDEMNAFKLEVANEHKSRIELLFEKISNIESRFEELVVRLSKDD